MKTTIRIILTMAIAIMIAVGFAGCSSDQHDEPNPDIAFKGDINDELLVNINNGAMMTGINCTQAKIYAKSADKADNPNSEWQSIRSESALSMEPSNTIRRFNLENLWIKNGRTWIYEPFIRTYYPQLPIIYAIWGQYNRATTHTEAKYGFGGDFEYDKGNKKLTLLGKTFDVERCDDKQLVLSYEETVDTDEYGRAIQVQKMKYVFECSPLRGHKYEPVSIANTFSAITMYDTENELKLHMLKELREYFGDELDPEKHPGYGINKKIDLAQYEEDIRNGVADEHFMYKYRD